MFVCCIFFLRRHIIIVNLSVNGISIATFLQNIYSSEAELFISGSEECIKSKEGTTQGGSESMAFYAASTSILTSSTSLEEESNEKKYSMQMMVEPEEIFMIYFHGGVI